jgi:hypothetical protein
MFSTELFFFYLTIDNMSRNVLNIESGRSFDVPNSTTVDNVVVWCNATGTSLGDSAVSLADQSLSGVNSITLVEQAANPGSGDTLWIDSSSGHLMLGDQNLHEIGDMSLARPSPQIMLLSAGMALLGALQKILMSVWMTQTTLQG